MKTKDRPGNQPPPTPPYPTRGITGLPSSDEEGLGVVGLCILRAHFAFACNWVSDIEKWRNKARMYMETKDRRSNRPPLTPPYPRRGIAGLPAGGQRRLRKDVKNRGNELGEVPCYQQNCPKNELETNSKRTQNEPKTNSKMTANAQRERADGLDLAHPTLFPGERGGRIAGG